MQTNHHCCLQVVRIPALTNVNGIMETIIVRETHLDDASGADVLIPFSWDAFRDPMTEALCSLTVCDVLLVDDSKLLDDEVKRDSVVADADEEDVLVNVETFFSSEADSLLTAPDFLLTILFLDEVSDQSFFASTADSIKVILWS